MKHEYKVVSRGYSATGYQRLEECLEEVNRLCAEDWMVVQVTANQSGEMKEFLLCKMTLSPPQPNIVDHYDDEEPFAP